MRMQSREQVGEYHAEVFVPTEENWQAIREAVMHVEQRTFEESHRFSEEFMREVFFVENSVAVLLRNTQGEIIGYTVAVPLTWETDRTEDVQREENGEHTAYVESTAIVPEDQGHGHARVLLRALDEHLRLRGYQYVERHAEISNGYAQTLTHFYGDRVEQSFETNTEEWGHQLWLRITL